MKNAAAFVYNKQQYRMFLKWKYILTCYAGHGTITVYNAVMDGDEGCRKVCRFTYRNRRMI